LSSGSISSSPTRWTTSTSSRWTPESEKRQLARLKKWNESRNQEEVDARLDDLRVAEGDGNLLSPIEEPLRAGGSIGEVCGAMRDVFGEYPGARSSRRRAS
jgi:methylmalonyl-CoA mutase, N-terminal domain